MSGLRGRDQGVGRPTAMDSGVRRGVRNRLVHYPPHTRRVPDILRATVRLSWLSGPAPFASPTASRQCTPCTAARRGGATSTAATTQSPGTSRPGTSALHPHHRHHHPQEHRVPWWLVPKTQDVQDKHKSPAQASKQQQAASKHVGCTYNARPSGSLRPNALAQDRPILKTRQAKLKSKSPALKQES
jgi:hypothetical protein